MKKVALVFVVAVLAPSLVLAWLAVRSLRDQQFLLERQQSLLDQRVTDTVAQNIANYLARQQQDFSAQVESLAGGVDRHTLTTQFDDELRRRWPLAEVGYCVTAAGRILSPPPNARPAAQMFRLDNSGFLGNREPVEVYLTANNSKTAGAGNVAKDNALNFGRAQPSQPSLAMDNSAAPLPESQQAEPGAGPTVDRRNPPPASQTLSGGGGGGSPASGAAANQMPPGPLPLTADVANGVPGTASRPAPTQAFVLDGNSADNSHGNRASQFANNGRNAFFIPSVNHAGARPGQQPAARGLIEGDASLPLVRTNSVSPAPVQEAFSTKQSKAGIVPREQPVPDHPAGQTNFLETDQQKTPHVVADNGVSKDGPIQQSYQNGLNFKAAESRKVTPQSQAFQNAGTFKAGNAAEDAQNNLSRVMPAEAEFRQLIGDQSDGMLARFLQNKLKLMCWHRLGSDPDLIFGAQLNLDQVVNGLRGLVRDEPSWGEGICLAVLDDNAKPAVLSRAGFQASWKRPFVATEIGDALPHWEVAAYLADPAQLTEAAHVAKLTLGLLVAVLVVAIGMGSFLIVRSLNAELKLARQKTDFVSNVSHELKTPLTSIRMFSELLAEGRIADPAKHRAYLHIITAETARLTRLINNVLDFSRMERGEKKYSFQACDLTEIVRTTADTFRPHLESAGFGYACQLPPKGILIRADADAVSQIIVNLLSNAEKYSGLPERRSPTGPGPAALAVGGPAGKTGAGTKEISLELSEKQSPVPYAEVRILDRGPGVPRGCEEKVFEKFYRAHDSLSSGIQGSGLGLTIARQIARAHGGDVVYEPRAGGGSCFSLRLPVQTGTANERK